MTWWMKLLLWGAGCLIGWLIGRPSGRGGAGFWWALVGGPVGIALFLLGEARRRMTGGPVAGSRANWPPSEDLDVLVQVRLDGNWRDASLRSWRQGTDVWEGWVHYADDDAPASAWFPAEDVRRVETSA
jgi:hypothetical protein